jgi:glycosyltransferase involved in cell wall biosynthesis
MERMVLDHEGSKSLRRIIVDLTPVRPGGESGGAKLLATELARQFSHSVAPECEYTLLTSGETHEELAWLDAGNVRRVCVDEPLPTQAAKRLSRRAIFHRVGQILERTLPRGVYGRIYRFYKAHFKSPQTVALLQGLEADLIFCPFTAPLYQIPGVPFVIVVHDLQYQAYPQFFTEEERYHSDYYFREACRMAARLICVSEYTRQMVLASTKLPLEKVITIQSTLINRLEMVAPERVQEVLDEYGLRKDGYLLYPANFWQHKNHETLLAAFSMYLSSHPTTDLKLVLTGAPGARMDTLSQKAEQMGLKGRVIFPGFVSPQKLSTLLQGCLALIFPSLYEGFGLPVLEAMSFGKAVLCSNLTSLPEVSESAAHLFDPRKPDEIANAIERIHGDSDYRNELAARGRRRVNALPTPEAWAGAYFDVFRQVVFNRSHRARRTGWSR